MVNNYWVPALERAQEVIDLICNQSGKLKMSDIQKKLKISKSTLFNLLRTMETLRWITKDQNDCYSPGVRLGIWGNSYFQQFDLVNLFMKEAVPIRDMLKLSVQLARLEGNQVLYLAKVEAPSQVQMVAGPGFRMPAHATGLGKMLLSALDKQVLDRLYPEEMLVRMTSLTLNRKSKLIDQLTIIQKQGYAVDLQEGVMGFCCVAAPVYEVNGLMIAAVSVSIHSHLWSEKSDIYKIEILSLSQRISMNLNY
ncbi:IclR family transcriptional regulator [Thermicanus aegyptius]|uniref:IclR family transcriptional regulator n=1 Tax=Thermicanus aegyptius TaxID=94009 RepID=UPI0004152C7E|nr:IclR family transcriptional regulator [Thermicanus aegyptius]